MIRHIAPGHARVAVNSSRHRFVLHRGLARSTADVCPPHVVTDSVSNVPLALQAKSRIPRTHPRVNRSFERKGPCGSARLMSLPWAQGFEPSRIPSRDLCLPGRQDKDRRRQLVRGRGPGLRLAAGWPRLDTDNQSGAACTHPAQIRTYEMLARTKFVRAGA